MKYFFLFLITVLTFSESNAQDCKFIKNETDKFTKNRLIHTQAVKVTSERIKVKNAYSIDKVEMQVKSENNVILIGLEYFFAAGLTVANTDNKLILLLEDGSTIDAPCVQNMPNQRGNAFTAKISYNFQLSMSDFAKLIKLNITDIRMTAQINPVEFSIAKEIQTKKIFNCLLQAN